MAGFITHLQSSMIKKVAAKTVNFIFRFDITD